MVGDNRRIELPDFKRVRVASGRFRGLRCVHTHLRGEPLTQDDLTDLALLRLDLMAAIAELSLPRAVVRPFVAMIVDGDAGAFDDTGKDQDTR